MKLVVIHFGVSKTTQRVYKYYTIENIRLLSAEAWYHVYWQLVTKF